MASQATAMVRAAGQTSANCTRAAACSGRAGRTPRQGQDTQQRHRPLPQHDAPGDVSGDTGQHGDGRAGREAAEGNAPTPAAMARASKTTLTRERGFPIPQIWLMVVSSSQNQTRALHKRARMPTPAAVPRLSITPAMALRNGSCPWGRRSVTSRRTCSRAASLLCSASPKGRHGQQDHGEQGEDAVIRQRRGVAKHLVPGEPLGGADQDAEEGVALQTRDDRLQPHPPPPRSAAPGAQYVPAPGDGGTMRRNGGTGHRGCSFLHPAMATDEHTWCPTTHRDVLVRRARTAEHGPPSVDERPRTTSVIAILGRCLGRARCVLGGARCALCGVRAGHARLTWSVGRATGGGNGPSGVTQGPLRGRWGRVDVLQQQAS